METLPLIILIVAWFIGAICILMNPKTWTDAPRSKCIRPLDRYRAWINNAIEGPMSGVELLALKDQGRIKGSTLVADGDSDEWTALDQYQLVRTELPKPQPVALPQAQSYQAAPVTSSGGVNLTRAGGVLLGLGFGLTLLFGMGAIEVPVIVAGIICMVLGLCRR